MAPDLPADNETADLTDYAEAVVTAVGNRTDLILVAQSLGGFTAPAAPSSASILDPGCCELL